MTKKAQTESTTPAHAKGHKEALPRAKATSGPSEETSSLSVATSQPEDGTTQAANATSHENQATSQPSPRNSQPEVTSSQPPKTTTQASATTAQRKTATSASVKVTPPSALGSAAPSIDPSSITDEQIQQALASLAIIVAILGARATPMTIDQRRKQPKMKKGADPLVPGVLDLADEYGVSIKGAATDEARADIALVARLQPLESKLVTTTQLVSDVLTAGRGRYWSTAMTAYGMLLRLVPRFPALQGELAPMASLLATTYKDAPTVLRKSEAKSLARSRATRKAKDEQTAAAATPVETPPATPSNNH